MMMQSKRCHEGVLARGVVHVGLLRFMEKTLHGRSILFRTESVAFMNQTS